MVEEKGKVVRQVEEKNRAARVLVLLFTCWEMVASVQVRVCLLLRFRYESGLLVTLGNGLG
jgi:hypothetical protein